MVGGYCLGVGVGVELVKKSLGLLWNNEKVKGLGVVMVVRKEVIWEFKGWGKCNRVELGE